MNFTCLINRIIHREDFPLEMYEKEAILAIREASAQLRWKETRLIYDLYREWSRNCYCAGWLDHVGHIDQFLSWAKYKHEV